MTVSCADPLRPELLWFLMEDPKLSHLSHIDLFGCYRNMENVLILYTNWGTSSTVQFCSLSVFCLYMYVHTQVHKKQTWTNALLYILCAYILLHTEQDSHTKALPLSSRVPGLKLRNSHSGYRSTPCVKEHSSPSEEKREREMKTQTTIMPIYSVTCFLHMPLQQL